MSKIDFLHTLKIKREIVWDEIKKYLPDREPKEHYNMVREYPERRGKYLRPTLILLSCEMFGGDPKKAIKTAAAMQTSEDWILVHDDIQDLSEHRRGKPALHKMHGIELAMNAGDALHLIMWNILRDNEKVLGPELTFKIMDYFIKMLTITTEGQTIEMMYSINKKYGDLKDEDYYEVVDIKTGRYTIVGPLQLGAIVAGASKKQLDALEKLGIAFGRAFQITDDTLNVSGDYKKYGKEIGGDIAEGKVTLMLTHLVNNCSLDEKKKILEIYKRKREEIGKDEIKYVIDLMNKYKSIDYAKKKAKEYANETKRIFDESFKDIPESDAKKAIRAGIDFIVNRDV